jgi:L-lactate dehydrogenase (cytochrome)
MFKPSLLPLLISFVVIAAGVGFFSFTKSTDTVDSGASSKAPISETVEADSQKSLPSLSMEEVAMHNNIDDCYIVIENKVYEVTGFIDQHPGGVAKITSGCGKEMTGIFSKIHSNKAWDLLKKFQIAVLE